MRFIKPEIVLGQSTLCWPQEAFESHLALLVWSFFPLKTKLFESELHSK